MILNNKTRTLNRDDIKHLQPFAYSIRSSQDDDTAVLDIQGFIGRDLLMEFFFGEESKNTIENLREELRSISQSKIIVNINSGGGDLNTGLVIKNMLESKNAEIITNLYGFSASAATIIHQAGTTRRMPENGSFMLIHRVMFGMCDFYNQNTLLSILEDMETIDNDLISMYVSASNATDQEIRELMDSGEGYGKWINAQTALEMGLVDELFEPADENDENTDHMQSVSEDDMENHKENIRRFANAFIPKMDEEQPQPEKENHNDRTQNVIASKAKRERELQLLTIKNR